MNLQPLSGEMVEVNARLSAELIRDIDMILTVSREKTRSQFIAEVLVDWYDRQLKRQVRGEGE